MLKAVIFDMDGVLIDSEPLHVRAIRDTLASHDVHMPLETLQGNMGRGARDFFEQYVDEYRLQVAALRLFEEMKSRLKRLFGEELQMMEGARELLSLCARDALDLAVASSTDADVLKMVLEKFQIAGMFKAVVSGQEVPRYKPDPDIFLETLKRLGANARECVVLEDSAAGVKAALSAGIPCVGFRSPHSGKQDLSGSALIVGHLSELDPHVLRGLADGIGTGHAS